MGSSQKIAQIPADTPVELRRVIERMLTEIQQLRDQVAELQRNNKG